MKTVFDQFAKQVQIWKIHIGTWNLECASPWRLMLKQVQNCNKKKIMQDLAASTSTTKPKIHLNLVFFCVLYGFTKKKKRTKHVLCLFDTVTEQAHSLQVCHPLTKCSKTIISLNVSFTKFMTFAKITSLHFNKSLSLAAPVVPEFRQAVGRQTKENKNDKNKHGIEGEVSIRI